MPKSRLASLALLSGAVALLAACAEKPQTAVTGSAAARPAELRVVDAPDNVRRELARQAQLQTPLWLDPELTGAPPPAYHGGNLDAGEPELRAAGVDIAPDVRVWQRWPAGTRQIYGPQPTVVSPVVRPVVVAPE